MRTPFLSFINQMKLHVIVMMFVLPVVPCCFSLSSNNLLVECTKKWDTVQQRESDVDWQCRRMKVKFHFHRPCNFWLNQKIICNYLIITQTWNGSDSAVYHKYCIRKFVSESLLVFIQKSKANQSARHVGLNETDL